MSISGVGQNYYQNYAAATKSTKNINSTEKFTLEKTSGTQELSEAEEMELFKKEFYQELSQITMHTTVSNAAVNVTEAAFKRMKDDPEYKQQVLNWIKHDLGASYGSRNASVMLTVGGTLEECRGDAWPVSADSEFGIRSQDSFYIKKDKQKELLEKYLEKQAQAKRQQQEMLNEKAAKMEQERSRLTKAWSSERQMAKASNAYDANIMTETVAGSDSLLG